MSATGLAPLGEHRNMGDCPVDDYYEPGRPSDRDPDCIACIAMGPPPVDSAAGFPVEGTTSPAVSPLEAAWAEADRVTRIACEKAYVAEAADHEWKEAGKAANAAWAAAEAIGPRPTRRPS